jgi:HlyD family secretion protein
VRALLRGLLSLAAAMILLSGCFGDDRPVVTTERVASGEVVQSVSAPGRVDAAARQDVAAGVSGTVATLEADDGGLVTAGQTIIRLDSQQVAAAQAQAEAVQAASAGGGGLRLDGGGRQTVETVNTAVRELDATVQPQLADARAQAATVMDPQQRAAAEAAIASAEQAYLATRAALLATGQAVAAQQDAAARAISDALNQAVAQAAAPQRAQAEAAIAAARAQADELEVRAPFDGTIQLGRAAATDGGGVALPPGLAGSLPAELTGLAGGGGGGGIGGTLRVGAPVAAGQTLFTVFDLSTLYVNADVDEFDAPEVAIGQRAIVVVDAFSDVELEGVVEAVRVEATATEAGGLGFPVRIRLIGPREPGPRGDAAMGGLRVGMTAGVEITTRTVDAAIVVPSRALLRREVGDVVFVLREGRAVQVPVQVDALGEQRAAVTGELSADDRVITTGYEGLGDGDDVRT